MVLHRSLIDLIVIQNASIRSYKRKPQIASVHTRIYTCVIVIKISSIFQDFCIAFQISYNLSLVHLIKYENGQNHSHSYRNQRKCNKLQIDNFFQPFIISLTHTLLHLISYISHCLYHISCFTKFLSKCLDMHIKCSRLTLIVSSPHI